jgi:hypothetical protein
MQTDIPNIVKKAIRRFHGITGQRPHLSTSRVFSNLGATRRSGEANGSEDEVTINGMEPADRDPKNGTYFMAGVWDTLNGEMAFSGHYTDFNGYFSSERICPADLAFERTYTYSLSDSVPTFTAEQINDDEPVEPDPPLSLYRRNN